MGSADGARRGKPRAPTRWCSCNTPPTCYRRLVAFANSGRARRTNRRSYAAHPLFTSRCLFESWPGWSRHRWCRRCRRSRRCLALGCETRSGFNPPSLRKWSFACICRSEMEPRRPGRTHGFGDTRLKPRGSRNKGTITGEAGLARRARRTPFRGRSAWCCTDNNFFFVCTALPRCASEQRKRASLRQTFPDFIGRLGVLLGQRWQRPGGVVIPS